MNTQEMIYDHTPATMEAIKDVILASGNKIFTVCFTKNATEAAKKKGLIPEERIMNGMLGVKKHLRGGDSTTAHCDYLLTCFDVQKKEYRNINLSTVKWLKVCGEYMEAGQ
jgi:hypothetical protein